jgi:hypothetical protein
VTSKWRMITIATEDGPTEVPAYPSQWATGLVITPGIGASNEPDGTWSLTHELTGHSIFSSTSIREIETVAKLVSRFDWTEVTGPNVRPAWFSEAREIVIEFKDRFPFGGSS